MPPHLVIHATHVCVTVCRQLHAAHAGLGVRPSDFVEPRRRPTVARTHALAHLCTPRLPGKIPPATVTVNGSRAQNYSEEAGASYKMDFKIQICLRVSSDGEGAAAAVRARGPDRKHCGAQKSLPSRAILYSSCTVALQDLLEQAFERQQGQGPSSKDSTKRRKTNREPKLPLHTSILCIYIYVHTCKYAHVFEKRLCVGYCPLNQGWLLIPCSFSGGCGFRQGTICIQESSRSLTSWPY